MLEIARMTDDERHELFRMAGGKCNLAPAIVEKDLWVCYTLDVLFHRFEHADRIIFKGGTSLSKCFGLIQRFSEDIDLILDWRLLGYGKDEPWEPRSNTKQDKFKLDSIERTNAFLAKDFAPKLKEAISAELGYDAKVYAGEQEETVLFEYPRTYSLSATLDVVKLEVGPMAAWTPSEEATIVPYVADVLPEGFGSLATVVRTASPERTFWEKATILHQEAMRPETKQMPRRYSRHYYDLYRLGHSFVLERALANADLLARVVEFKQKFYRAPWSRLEEAKPGMLRLVPSDFRLGELSRDYAAMHPMLFGDYPAFDELVAYLGELEGEINSLLAGSSAD